MAYSCTKEQNKPKKMKKIFWEFSLNEQPCIKFLI